MQSSIIGEHARTWSLVAERLDESGLHDLPELLVRFSCEEDRTGGLAVERRWDVGHRRLYNRANLGVGNGGCIGEAIVRSARLWKRSFSSGSLKNVMLTNLDSLKEFCRGVIPQIDCRTRALFLALAGEWLGRAPLGPLGFGALTADTVDEIVHDVSGEG